MITAYCLQQVYIIEYFPGSAPAFQFSFDKTFLPEKLMQRIASLPFFQPPHKTQFHLNPQQDTEVSLIFKNLLEEKHSTYRFSKELRGTYLVELLHFLMKLHLSSPPDMLNFYI